MDWQAAFSTALNYDSFLSRYGAPHYSERWRAVLDRVQLSPSQRQLLASFARDMNVLCLAGAWCGDCIQQCPIFEQFARTSSRIHLRFLDRDEHHLIQQELSINGGKRVPVVVFLSEDYYEIARYGERTLAQYRRMAREQLGPSCPTGLTEPSADSLAATAQDWLDEFERVQLLLRLSPRLRQKHQD